jgi:hypothetical protein
MVSGSFVSLNYACEESLVDYFVAQCDPLQLTASYYMGQGNVADLEAPAVVIGCEMGTQVYPKSKVYDMMVTIGVKEMSADTGGSSLNSTTNPKLGVLAANIFNAVCNPSASALINLNNSRSFVTQFVHSLDNRHSITKDAIITEFVVQIVGSLSGSI